MEQNTFNSFPDQYIDPKKKDDKFIMKYGKAMYTTFRRSGYKMFYNNRTQYREEILYAQGKQSVDQYKQRLDAWEDQDESYLNLDWSILNLCSKFVNIVQGKLNKVGMEPICTAIDALAIDQKKDYMAKMQAYKDLQQWMAKAQIQASPEFSQDQQEMPVSMDPDELEIFLNMTLKHRWSMSMEKAIKAVLNSNDFNQVKKELIWDLIVIGVGALKITEMQEGHPVIEKVNPENLIVSNASSEKFRNMQHVGEVKMMTPGEFFRRSGDRFTDEQKKDILENFTRKNTYAGTSGHTSNFSENEYEAGMIEVLDFVFTSTDEVVHERKKRQKREP